MRLIIIIFTIFILILTPSIQVPIQKDESGLVTTMENVSTSGEKAFSNAIGNGTINLRLAVPNLNVDINCVALVNVGGSVCNEGSNGQNSSSSCALGTGNAKWAFSGILTLLYSVVVSFFNNSKFRWYT